MLYSHVNRTRRNGNPHRLGKSLGGSLTRGCGTKEMAASSPAKSSKFLGLWTYTRMEDDDYHRVLGEQGLPWAVRALLQQFTAQREFLEDGDGFLFRSKMLTGSWNELRINVPTTFTVLGYTIDTLITWEDEGQLLVSTMKTTSADGYIISGSTNTTRITHAIDAGELVITTITPEGQYRMWMSAEKRAA
jgi:hypothetical protein